MYLSIYFFIIIDAIQSLLRAFLSRTPKTLTATQAAATAVPRARPIRSLVMDLSVSRKSSHYEIKFSEFIIILSFRFLSKFYKCSEILIINLYEVARTLKLYS